MNYFGSAQPQLARLRATAQDAVNSHDHAAVWRLLGELRLDTEFWTGIWAPAVAISARALGRPEARELLDEAIDAGFSQPELFGTELSQAFGDDADWDELHRRMRANVPLAPVTLRRWPQWTYRPDVGWYRLDPDAEARLRQRIPAPRASAWETALELLRWTAQRWRHANDHVDKPDAHDILDKVEAGQRFACVEYSIVLAQALNALAIPARRVHMLCDDYHHGLGKGHVTAEAWIDDLRSWVLLDGQNGMYWTTDDGAPASPSYLQSRFIAGLPRSRHVCVSSTMVDDEAAEGWWRHFRHLSSEGTVSIVWDEEFVPAFQAGFTRNAGILVTEAALAYPDLSELATAVVDGGDGPALRFTPAHPFATGVSTIDGEARDSIGLAENWDLSRRGPGEHRLEVATRTPYATLTPHPLEFAKLA